MTEEKIICECCGACLNEEEVSEFDGQFLCSDCLSTETTHCSCCGERIWVSNNSGDSHITLCESCYETYYTHCNDCDRIIHRDHACYYDEEPYCQSCYDRCSEERSIKDYGYKPEPIFYGDGNRFFGVELEVDDAGEDDDNAYEVIRTANRNGKEHIYCKHNGSLDEGFEVVTHPMTLDYHLNKMPWKEVLSELRSMSYCSHNAGSCGLHIHVNRSTFGETTKKQEECIGRVLYLFEKFWSELLKFSRRSYSQLERWAARYVYKDNPKEMLDHAKKGSSNGRYSCINLQNYYTIEFRIFRGTLKYNTLIATLQLVNRVCSVAFSFSDEEIQALSWSEFVSYCTEPELVQYLKERRIYINEPVECEEEI